MNIAESFAQYMEDQGFGTLGTDLFIASVPQNAPDSCWWIVLAGGAPDFRNETGEMMKDYTIEVYYRNTSAETVYNRLHAFEVETNKADCVQLTDFDTIDIQSVLFPADQDLDNEDRTIGLLQVQIKTYYKE
jgi:hypothetical protein